MSTSTVPVFDGTPKLTDAKVETIKAWLTETMGDADKACEFDQANYYEGFSIGLISVLNLLYDIPINNDNNG